MRGEGSDLLLLIAVPCPKELIDVKPRVGVVVQSVQELYHECLLLLHL